MELDYKKLAAEKKDDILRDLGELIAIDSSEDLNNTSAEYPVGPGPVKAMKKFLSFAERDGFHIKNVDNYAGRVDFGEGDERLGIIGHMDVVPAGDGWKTDPFKMLIQDGKIIGRGSADDKGPALAAYYGMLLLKEAGFKPKKKIDFVVGTNEETNWVGINYYLKHEPTPDQVFSPDAEFPIINGEQGIYTLTLTFKDDPTTGAVKLLSFKAGIAENVTPQKAYATISAANLNEIKDQFDQFIQDNKLEGQFEIDGETAKLEVTGQGAHASAPQVGRNAATFLGLFLDQLDFAGRDKNYVHFLADVEHEDFQGKKLGVFHHDDLMGDLSSAPSVFTYEADGEAVIKDNIRYPQGTDPDKMVSQVNEKFGDMLTGSYDSFEEPHYVPGDDPLVQTLLKVYEHQTGNKGHEVVIGGGTYGRLFEHGVAYGAQPEDAPMVMHQANEYMKVDDLINSIAIYAEAIYELTK
ncbi:MULTISPECIES: dipeptidase PepV [Lactobacillus]|uniref:Dipeptidase PepV n=1 Tax=Lactobacillus xujianguonis TaxID=2495899 RepID=A0A437SUC1_9LACO|nr:MULTISPECIES: dipeptidase PepV [Lactobacillus]RVU70480.1 dipeptidase PepV [Lactobacillus xujianguonis]RVU76850.1 dipeptidase PepV [Lactobacillus xujianguonis]